MKINVSVGWKTNLADLLNDKMKNTVHGSLSCTKLCLFLFPVVSDEDLTSWKRKVGEKKTHENCFQFYWKIRTSLDQASLTLALPDKLL